ncbi:hypothetical protein [Streptomyces sp. NPDC094472]|uniref:hypothetical protein n=1 Tax=unclassified Streptomyces TaxID=2593676 RepID=UPI00332CE1EF
MRERLEVKDELRAQVRLSPDTSRRLRAIAARAGLQLQQVIAQLAGHIRTNEDGAWWPPRSPHTDRHAPGPAP